MIQFVVLRLNQIMYGRSSCHDALREVVDAETFQRDGVEMFVEHFVGVVVGEDPIVEDSEVVLGTKKVDEILAFVALHQHLGRVEALQQLVDVFVVALGKIKLACRHIEEGNTRNLLVEMQGCQKIVKFAYDKLGHIDVLVNNAGISSPNVPFIQMPVEQYMKVISTNLLGTFHMCHLVVPHMVKDKKGCVINISSIGGLMGVAGQADYCASKSGIIGMTRALSLEFAKENIRFNCICPGMIWTDLLRNIDKEKLDALAKTVPFSAIIW